MSIKSIENTRNVTPPHSAPSLCFGEDFNSFDLGWINSNHHVKFSKKSLLTVHAIALIIELDYYLSLIIKTID
jgi:hypothetical protein